MRFDIGSQVRNGMIVLQKHMPQQVKGLCPNCNSNNIIDKTIQEGDEIIPISSCQDCSWWGSKIKRMEAKPMQTKKIPRKYAAKKLTEYQEKVVKNIMEKMRAKEPTTSWLEAKNEYFDNPEYWAKELKEEINKNIRVEAEKEVCQKHNRQKDGNGYCAECDAEPKKAKTMSIAETKLGVTMVLTKTDCKTIGISPETMTREAIRQIRAKLGLPEKPMRD